MTLRNLSHTWVADVDVLLVGPGGQTAVLLSDAGYGGGAVDATLTFDDEAAGTLNDVVVSGTYQPTNFGADDAFPAPAPTQDGSAALSAFDGTDPNGTWRLYVLDEYSEDTGSIAGGWSLSITANAAPTAANDAYHVKEDRVLRRAAPGVLANDAAAAGDALTVRKLTGPTKGTLTLNANGSFAYKPRRNFHGTDSFTYEVTDAAGGTAQAKVTIKVLSRPD